MMPIDYYAVCVTCQSRGPAVWRPGDPDEMREWLREHPPAGGHDVRIEDENSTDVESWRQWGRYK